MDFAIDASQWCGTSSSVGRLLPGMAMFFMGEHQVAGQLKHLYAATSDPDEQKLLKGQERDEELHTELFRRFFAEVIKLHGTLAELISAINQHASPIFRVVFGRLTEAIELVAAEPHNQVAWIEAVVCYHLLAEAWLALPRQRKLQRKLVTHELLPGFQHGFHFVTLDEIRHVCIGWHLLQHRMRREAETARIIAIKLLTMAQALLMVGASGTGGRSWDDAVSLPRPVDPATESLTHSLSIIGLSDLVVTEVRKYYSLLPKISAAS
jgi:hypothetical protein